MVCYAVGPIVGFGFDDLIFVVLLVGYSGLVVVLD